MNQLGPNPFGLPENTPFDKEVLLPVANVGRIVKEALTPKMKMSKDAKDLIQHCGTEFVCFLVSEMAHICEKEKRTTMNGDTLISALHRLGMDNFVAPMEAFFERYKITQSEMASDSAQPPSKTPKMTSPPPVHHLTSSVPVPPSLTPFQGTDVHPKPS